MFPGNLKHILSMVSLWYTNVIGNEWFWDIHPIPPWELVKAQQPGALVPRSSYATRTSFGRFLPSARVHRSHGNGPSHQGPVICIRVSRYECVYMHKTERQKRTSDVTSRCEQSPSLP
ncbi:hypothetical protein RUM44_011622 [Polyplax serrata]|uniref:Uncharacterized protein n=1 Tax=Polyplax serrata TaxID=468196 RepID=A0ABR1AQK6_POLSC